MGRPAGGTPVIFPRLAYRRPVRRAPRIVAAFAAPADSVAFAELEDLIIAAADRYEPGLRNAIIASLAGSLTTVTIGELEALLAGGDLDALAARLVAAVDTLALTAAVAAYLAAGASSGAHTAIGALEGVDAPTGPYKQRTDRRSVAITTMARDHAAALVTAITSDTRAAVNEIVTDATINDVEVRKVARALKDVVGLTPRYAKAVWRYEQGLLAQGVPEARARTLAKKYSDRLIRARARTIARTEMMVAIHNGQQIAWQQLVTAGILDANLTRRKWVVTKDDRTCERCAPLHGQTVDFSAPFATDAGALMQPPLHPNCIPAGALVTGPRAVVATSRWYTGEMIELETRNGHRLSVTPNHPVLTPEGWVAAGLLHEGGYVVSGRGQEWVAASVNPHDIQVPTRIEEIAGALAEPGRVASRCVKVTSEDFHGDGGGSDVAVVRADRLLLDTLDAAFGQPTSQQRLGGRDPGAALLPRDRPALHFRSADHAATGCVVCGADIGEPLLGGAVGLLDPVGVGNRAALDTVLDKEATDGGAADASTLRQRLLAGSAGVCVDEIVRVIRYPFTGHVYNLQTVEGWYSANGIVTHNCRCTMVLVDNPEPFPSAALFSSPSIFHLPGKHDQSTHGRTGAGAAFAGMPMQKSTGAKAKQWRAAMQERYDTDTEFRLVADAATLYAQGHFQNLRTAGKIAAGDSALMIAKQKAGGGGLAAVKQWQDSINRSISEPLEDSKSPMADLTVMFVGQERFNTRFAERTREGATTTDAAMALHRGIATSPALTTPIYRGERGYGRPALPEVGTTVNMKAATSFTAERQIASDFAANKAKGQPKGGAKPDYNVIYEIPPGARGLPIAALSPWGQQEVLTAGQFTIAGITQDGTEYTVSLEQTGVYDID